MTTHILTLGQDGQTEDVMYFCSADCQARKVWSVAGVRNTSRFSAGQRTDDKGYSYSWGAYPGGSETDYDVWCVGCGDFLWHGLNCECEDTEAEREPLTRRQLSMLSPAIAHDAHPVGRMRVCGDWPAQSI